MTTIAKLVIDMTADPTGVTSGVAKAEASIRSLGQTTSAVTAASTIDFARAGASASQIAQLTGVSMNTATDAARRYGGQLGLVGMESRGVALAQSEMAAAGMVAANASKVAAGGFATAGASLGRLRMGLTSAVAQMAGMPPIMARIGSTGAVMGAGMEATLGVLAVVAAGIGVWKSWHEEATKAAKEQDKLTDSLLKWYEKQREGPAGELPKQIDAMTAHVKSLRAELDKLMAHKFFAEVAAVGEGGSKIMAWTRVITAAEARVGIIASKVIGGVPINMSDVTTVFDQFGNEVTKATNKVVANIKTGVEATLAAQREARLKIMTDSASLAATQAGDIASLVGSGNATKGEVALANSLLTDYRANLAELQKQYGGIADAQMKAFNLSQQAADVGIIKSLTDAFVELGKRPVDAAVKLAEALLHAREAAVKAHAPIADLAPAFVGALSRLDKLLAGRADKLDETSLRLRKTIDELDAAFLNFGAIPGIQLGGKTLVPIVMHPTVTQPNLGQYPQMLGPPTVPAAGQTINEARLRAAFAVVSDAAHDAGSKLRDLASGTFFGVLRSIATQLNPFATILSSIGNATKPLMPIFARLAAIVENTIGPVFQAFAPVLESLLPLFDALLRVLSPILRALAPLFGALVPILNALFPVIKAAAISFTYVVQAASFLAGILFNIAGGIAVAIGGLIAGIGTIISKIPFMGGIGNDIKNFGNTIKDLGHGFEQTANGLFQTADDMAKARDAINGVNIDPAQTALDSLGAAANLAAGALSNVPAGYKVALARFNATTPASSTKPPTQITPPVTPPDTHPISPPHVTLPGGSSASGGSAVSLAPVVQFQAGSIVISGSDKSARDLFDEILSEGQTRARAQLGDPKMWAQVQQ